MEIKQRSILRHQGVPPSRIANSVAEAIVKGWFRQVRFLLENGVSANLTYQGQLPLRLLAFVRHPSWTVTMAQNLLEKNAQVGLTDESGRNAFHEACRQGNLDLLNVLLKAIDFDFHQKDKSEKGDTGLHLAVLAGHVNIVKRLIVCFKHYQVHVDPTDNFGLTPLMKAYKNDQLVCAELLKEAGADLSIRDSNGKTAQKYESEAMECERWRREGERLKSGKLRYDDVKGWARKQERLRSAPPDHHRNSQDEDKSILNVDTRINYNDIPASLSSLNQTNKMLQKCEKNGLHIAHGTDIRNDPVAMFHVTPCEFFNEQEIAFRLKQKIQSNPEKSQQQLSAETNLLVNNNKNKPKMVPLIIPTHQSSCHNLPNKGSWRRAVRPLYYQFEFQCSKSYRTGIVQVFNEDQDGLNNDLEGMTLRPLKGGGRRGSNISMRGGHLGKKGVKSSKGGQKSSRSARQLKP